MINVESVRPEIGLFEEPMSPTPVVEDADDARVRGNARQLRRVVHAFADQDPGARSLTRSITQELVGHDVGPSLKPMSSR